MLNLAAAQKILLSIITSAGQIIKDRQASLSITRFKADQEIQTNLDNEVENHIIKNLNQHFPDHAIYAEESGKNKITSSYTWYIDPIDGTRNAFKKIPIFAISIALAKNNELLVSAVYNPLTHELFFAQKNAGAYVIKTNHDHLFEEEKIEKLQTSNIKKLADATIHITIPKHGDPDRQSEKTHIMKLIDQAHRLRTIGSVALAICYTAQGSYDGFVNSGHQVRPYDLAGGLLILKEAGGQITNREGENFSLNEAHLIASNSNIHPELLKIFKQ